MWNTDIWTALQDGLDWKADTVYPNSKYKTQNDVNGYCFQINI